MAEMPFDRAFWFRTKVFGRRVFWIEAQASFDFDSNQQSLYKEWRDDLTQIQFFGGP